MLTIPYDMTASHVPVLAGELIEALDPQPGQTAIDCTFGAGGHARLIAERLGPAGTLIAIDRDPVAESHFEQLAAEVSCATRFVHAPFAEGLRALLAEGVRADLVYVDLGISSMQVDTWERGFSYSYDAPLDMRMDPEQELDAATVVTPGPSGASPRSCASTATSATRGRSPARSCGSAPSARSRRPARWSTSSTTRSPPAPGSPAAIRPSARSRPSASRSTTSSARSTRRSRWPGRSCGRTAALQAFPSTAAKTVA